MKLDNDKIADPSKGQGGGAMGVITPLSEVKTIFVNGSYSKKKGGKAVLSQNTC